MRFLGIFVLVFGIVGSFLVFGSDEIGVVIEKEFCLGTGEVFFESLMGICEDSGGNFFVLDGKGAKVYKFSGDGKKLSEFGNRGHGPGDLFDPHYISVLGKDRVVVHESRDFVSVFDLQGTFVERKKLGPGLELYYVGGDDYVGWRWTRGGKERFVSRAGGKTVDGYQFISIDAFSVNVPDETGRRVLFNYFADEYTPFFLFDQDEGHVVLGISDRYELKVIDKASYRVSTVSRDIKGHKIGTKERDYFAGLIRERVRYPEKVKKMLTERIPEFQNVIAGIHVAGGKLWVVRMNDTVNPEDIPSLVDIFSISGTFLGTTKLEIPPLFVSDKYLYVIETNDQEDLLLCKYRYRLKLGSKVNRN